MRAGIVLLGCLTLASCGRRPPVTTGGAMPQQVAGTTLTPNTPPLCGDFGRPYLAPNSVGAALMTRLIESGEIKHLTQNIIKPHYDQCLDTALSLFSQKFADLPVRLHKPEGAFFLWLWVDGMKISSNELYPRLKRRNVFIIPGEEFFIDIDPSWKHTRECIRLNYAQSESVLSRGFDALADEIRKVV